MAADDGAAPNLSHFIVSANSPLQAKVPAAGSARRGKIFLSEALADLSSLLVSSFGLIGCPLLHRSFQNGSNSMLKAL